MPNPIDSPEYWIEDYRPTSADLDMLYEYVLDQGRPLTIEALAGHLVRHHVQQAVERHRASKAAGGAVYQPSDRYEVSQQVRFPALNGAAGVVEAVRPGNNPEYGPYEVIQVRFGSTVREFAAGLTWQHALVAVEMDVDPEAVARRYDAVVAPQLAVILGADREWLRHGERWILKALLPKLNAGHMNLAEAIIMLAGEPLPGQQIIQELDLDESVAAETRVMALDAALAVDERFRNVGSPSLPLWAVTTQAV